MPSVRAPPPARSMARLRTGQTVAPSLHSAGAVPGANPARRNVRPSISTYTFRGSHARPTGSAYPRPARRPASLPRCTSRNSRGGRRRRYALAIRSRLPRATSPSRRPSATRPSTRTRPSSVSVCDRAVGTSSETCVARSMPDHSCRKRASLGVMRRSPNPPSSVEGPRDEGGRPDKSPRSAYVIGTCAATESGPRRCAWTPSQPPARLRTITCCDPDSLTLAAGQSCPPLA